MKINTITLLSIWFLACLTGCSAFGQNPEQHLVAGYNLNGNAKEISQSALRGKPNGIKPATDRFGQAGQATQFTEAGYAIRGYITLPVQISPEKLPQISICFWIKACETYQKATPLSSGNDKNRGISTTYSNGAQHWTASAGKDGMIKGPAVLKDQWTFIAVIYDHPNEQARLIVNNEVFAGRARMRRSDANLVIGSLNGAMDDLQIFDTVLSLAEIEKIYGKPIDKNTEAYTIDDRSEYRKRLEERRKCKVQPGDIFIVGYDEILIRDSVNSPNTLHVFKEGDTVNVLNSMRNEWFEVKNQQNLTGFISGHQLESACYKTGGLKTMLRLNNLIGNIFRFNRFSNWLIIAVFTFILIIIIRKRNELNAWFQMKGHTDPREAYASKSGGTTAIRRTSIFDRYFPVERPKWWIISPGLVFGLMLIAGSLWDSHELEWFFNEGASLIPKGYSLPIHWTLWGSSIVIIMLLIALFLESLTIAGPFWGLLRMGLCIVINLMAMIVAFYLIAGLLFVMIGLLLILFALFALLGRRRRY